MPINSPRLLLTPQRVRQTSSSRTEMAPDNWGAIGGLATMAGTVLTLAVWRWQVVARREDQTHDSLGAFFAYPRGTPSKDFEMLPLTWAAHLERKLPEVQVTVWV